MENLIKTKVVYGTFSEGGCLVVRTSSTRQSLIPLRDINTNKRCQSHVREEHSGDRGGTPLFLKISKMSKIVKNMSPGLPRGALGDVFLTSWTPADRVQAVGGREGGYPPWRSKPMSNLPSGFTGPSRSTMALVTLTRTN